MFKDGEENCKKYNELKSEYTRLKNQHCGITSFIIKSNTLKNNGKSPILHKDKTIAHKRSASYEFYNELEKLVLGVTNDN
jgi:hypothetical protein